MAHRISASLLLTAALACGGGSANITIGTMPQGASYHGVWQSPQYGEMHLCQTGAQVTGDYVKNERQGRIQGTVQGDVLRFTWEERRQMVVGRTQVTRGRGYFRLSIGQDDDQFIEGAWGHDNSETGGGPWNGVKLRRGEPTRCMGRSDSAGSGSDDGYDDYDDYDDDYEDDSYDDGGGAAGDDVDTDELEGLDDF